MADEKEFDVVIVGGSYAGLSAAMTLGRSLRSVLIVDSGKPCNRQTPHAHNFITHDGATPSEILDEAKAQVLAYPTVKLSNDLVTSVTAGSSGFTVATREAKRVKARKILFATGVKDLMKDLKGFAECWGISVLHCPYCHGYEVANTRIGILANGETAFELCKLIHHWSKNLTLFTDGGSGLTQAQSDLIEKLDVEIVTQKIEELNHRDGNLESVTFADGTTIELNAIFTRLPFEQHCEIPVTMGCQTTQQGHVEVDMFQKTNVAGVFCAGDNTTFFRAVPVAIAEGTKAGAMINRELLSEELPG